MNFHQLIAMDGYGTYVWTAYCITLIVFTINVVISLREKKSVQKYVKDYLAQSTQIQ